MERAPWQVRPGGRRRVAASNTPTLKEFGQFLIKQNMELYDVEIFYSFLIIKDDTAFDMVFMVHGRFFKVTHSVQRFAKSS